MVKVTKTFIMDIFDETPQQREIADHNVYLQLKDLNYTNEEIANHMSYSKENLGYLISRFTFINSLEYKLQEKEGTYQFNGNFYITQSVRNLLDAEEILEIYTFTQDLVKQHKGVDYLQSFYHIEQDCELFFIDQLSKSMKDTNQYSEDDNYCTLMLASDY
ncbi:hypothetical protein [Gelidibacter pelagius]|uniref:Uncharacterized protein n=1 Tax=Gelidibacter pelagius TaxID=2819985 RepID=A0ABS3SM78_9FLAO|nr:hypothetical protein [Gelidibacter pelagius]MBO3096815.1 hypothetical protein [Gelidibacter pelagius]